jgi:hypothetical protein|tara:strand:- start:6 stop:203 length:198 start_codon:yes stop_codon:yes gene_type:complete
MRILVLFVSGRDIRRLGSSSGEITEGEGFLFDADCAQDRRQVGAELGRFPAYWETAAPSLAANRG